MRTVGWELQHYCKATWIVRDLPSNYYKIIRIDFLALEFVTMAYDIYVPYIILQKEWSDV